MFESYERLFNGIRSMWQRRYLKDSFSKVFIRINTTCWGNVFLDIAFFLKKSVKTF